jgi:hypothetical protein
LVSISRRNKADKMPLRVQCSAGHLMMVPDHRAGTVLRCANCGIDVQVPPAGGIAGKEIAKPRIATPVIARNEAKPGGGPTARQSPQVAGHSTAAKSSPALPALSKPATKPRSKPAPPKVEETAVVAKKAAPVEAAPVAESPVASPPMERPIESPEIVFTTPVTTVPKPVVSKVTPAIDPATVETVQLPPKKIVKPTIEEKPPAPAPVVPKLSRQTLTGTVIVPAPEPVSKPTELFEINDEPEPPAPPVAAPPPILEPPIAQPVLQPALQSAAFTAAPEPEPAPPPMMILCGVQPTSSQRHTTWQLAAALAATALLSIGPALWEITDFLRSESGPDVAQWAFLLLMFGVVQFASIALLVQVPDWSSVWIVTLQSLAFAAMYAAVLGLTAITSGNSTLIETLQLNQQYSSKIPPWCVCMAATYACIAFFAGRISAKWHKVLRQVQAAEQATAHA